MNNNFKEAPYRLKEFGKVVDGIKTDEYAENQAERMDYSRIAAKIGALVDLKQKAYGDSFGKAPKILRVLYPNGIMTDQYEDVLAIVRILDKFSRIATDKDALGENPWQDIAGYAILMNKGAK